MGEEEEDGLDLGLFAGVWVDPLDGNSAVRATLEGGWWYPVIGPVGELTSL